MEDRLSAISRAQHLSSREFQDATHRIPDGEIGRTEVPNGHPLCKIYHLALDKDIPGINEDYRNELRQNTLKEVDSPMLKDGPRGLHHQKLFLPGSKSNRPGTEGIRKRYENFRIIE